MGSPENRSVVRRRRSTLQSPTVRAWQLTESSELPGHVTVLLVDRDPAGRTVDVLTDKPGAARVQYDADDAVAIVRLAQ